EVEVPESVLVGTNTTNAPTLITPCISQKGSELSHEKEQSISVFLSGIKSGSSNNTGRVLTGSGNWSISISRLPGEDKLIVPALPSSPNDKPLIKTTDIFKDVSVPPQEGVPQPNLIRESSDNTVSNETGDTAAGSETSGINDGSEAESDN
ncbi:hypothetical protein, partial [Escherichia coli]|uniref:hypothetical protein n=1 Tax=Escherichia coli TaxID=562 RepID=UPI00307967FA